MSLVSQHLLGGYILGRLEHAAGRDIEDILEDVQQHPSALEHKRTADTTTVWASYLANVVMDTSLEGGGYAGSVPFWPYPIPPVSVKAMPLMLSEVVL
jgi:hypothetical protein